MKKTKKIILSAIIIIYILINFAFATTGKVNTEATRVRIEPNTNSTILTVIYKDDKVEIIDESDGWYKISYGDYTGYIKKSFLDVDNVETNATNTTNNAVVDNTEQDTDNSTVSSYGTEDTVTTLLNTDVTLKETVNLKILPSFLSKNNNQFEQGKVLKVKAELNNWIQVTDDTVTGWILKTKIVDSSSITKASIESLENNTNANTLAENTTANNSTNEINTVEANNTNTTNTTTNEASVNKTGYINVETANIRELASSTSKIIYKLDLNDTVTIVAEQGEWYKITNSEVNEGYVSKLLVTIK